MESFFLGCFLFGALFTLVTALLGAFDVGLDLGHHGGSLDASGAHLPAVHGHDLPLAKIAHPLLALVNTSSLLAFLTWFGGAGYLALRVGHWGLVGALLGAVPVGLAGGALIAWVLNRIRAGDRFRRAEDDRLDGTLARVTVGIPENGVGEIVFTQRGARRSEAARGPAGTAIPEDAEVLVIGYERGLALVEPWTKVLAGASEIVPAAEAPQHPIESHRLKEE